MNQPENPVFYSGFVAIVGRPNVGKSTLLNSLSGIRLAIVSPKPQTTRHNIRAILDEPDAQIVFIDTPGIHKPKTKLGEFMVDSAYNALNDADVIVLMIDATSPVISDTEKNCCEKAKKFKKPLLLLINKVDLITKEELLPIIERFMNFYPFETVIPISVKKEDGLEIIKSEIKKRLPEGPRYFPTDSITDQTERKITAELIREQILRFTSEEIPHGTAVEIEAFEEEYDETEERTFVRIQAVIYCEKESHKRILIGKKGEMIKRIGTFARKRIEEMIQCKSFLEIHVKVREDWRNKNTILEDLGYKKQK